MPHMIEITIKVLVHDIQQLEQAALRRYIKCWHDSDWTPSNAEEAFFENFIASNDNPESPLDVGVEIISWEKKEG